VVVVEGEGRVEIKGALRHNSLLNACSWATNLPVFIQLLKTFPKAVILVTIDWIWIDNCIYWMSHLVITSKDYALTVLHTSQITIGHTRSSDSVTVFNSHCLVVASNSEHSPSSGFLNYPWPQLPASHSNSSQQWN
jgi:hypothetical protein